MIRRLLAELKLRAMRVALLLPFLLYGGHAVMTGLEAETGTPAVTEGQAAPPPVARGSLTGHARVVGRAVHGFGVVDVPDGMHEEWRRFTRAVNERSRVLDDVGGRHPVGSVDDSGGSQ